MICVFGVCSIICPGSLSQGSWIPQTFLGSRILLWFLLVLAGCLLAVWPSLSVVERQPLARHVNREAFVLVEWEVGEVKDASIVRFLECLVTRGNTKIHGWCFILAKDI